MPDDIFIQAAHDAASGTVPDDTLNKEAWIAEQVIFNLFARRDDLGKSILRALWDFAYKGYHSALGYPTLHSWNQERLYPKYGDYATDMVRVTENILKPINAAAHSETPLLTGNGEKVTVDTMLDAPVGNLRMWSAHFDKAPEMKEADKPERLTQQEIVTTILTETQTRNLSAKIKHTRGVVIPYYDQMLADGTHVIVLKNPDGSGLDVEQYNKFLRRTRPFMVLAG